MSDLLRPPSAPGHAREAANLLGAVRARAPLTHCITNAVVTGFTANALLAIGAAPAMVDIVGEAGIFAGAASGLLVNLGTPTPEQRRASREAVAGAVAAGTPWVLDPVAIGTLPIRTELARELLHHRPASVRGNASEILALAGRSAGGRGVDATATPEDAADAAVELARGSGAVVAVSGPVDLITDGERIVRVANGDPLLTRVTGGGCALGAVIAAFLGAARADADAGADALGAVVAAHLAYAVAAERAASRASGPGSFAVSLLDALAELRPENVESAARIELGEVAA